MAKKIYTFETIDSTNNCAKALAGVFAEQGTVVFAEKQTAGRGRLGRSWDSNPNENLTFSVILRPSVPPESVNLLPLFAAVALAAAVERATGVKVDCKWPNDLLINGRKFAGILLEGSISQGSVDYVVLGIGINVNQERFAPELKETATSLRLATGKEIDRVLLFRTIMKSFEDHHARMSRTHFQSVVPVWTAHTAMLNREITVSLQGTTLSGIARGLSSDGGLILNTDGQDRTLFAGDVTILKK